MGKGVVRDRLTLTQVCDQYEPVRNELLSKPVVKPYKMSWIIKESIDPFDKHRYPDVCFLNPKYVAPKKGLKPWGGTKGKKVPKGCYNANDYKYNEFFAAGFVPWSRVIDTPIINRAKYPLNKVVAEMLWEITFYGWSEDKTEKRVKEIEGKISEAKKEVKAGKCITILPKKKGGLKVVIPNCVQKQLKDIIDKESKKCGTCMGYGLWAFGASSPMGPMDARDGNPTLACPECGANRNPKGI